MSTETYNFVYSTNFNGASQVYSVSGTAFTNAQITFTDSPAEPDPQTMESGDTFTFNSVTYTFMGTSSNTGTLGFFASDGTARFFFSDSVLTGNLGKLDPAGTEQVTCFTAGTLIMTEHGEVPVEQLLAGDMVRTASGTLRPVKWLGEQRISLRFMSRDRSLPVRIAAGALGEMQPARDLVVSPGHAVLVDGVLCNAAALINGTTITRAEQAADFSYYHVELDSHDLLVSEGIPSESYLCTMDRNMFANARDYEARFGGDMTPVMPMALPRATVQSQLPQSVRERLFTRRAA